MTPLEKAKAEEGRVNYCDECEQFKIVGNAAYCKVDGKLIHPIMMARGQGTGPAWNCKKRRKPITNYDRLLAMSMEELADFYCNDVDACPPGSDMKCIDELYAHGEGPYPPDKQCMECWLNWLREEGE